MPSSQIPCMCTCAEGIFFFFNLALMWRHCSYGGPESQVVCTCAGNLACLQTCHRTLPTPKGLSEHLLVLWPCSCLVPHCPTVYRPLAFNLTLPLFYVPAWVLMTFWLLLWLWSCPLIKLHCVPVTAWSSILIFFLETSGGTAKYTGPRATLCPQTFCHRYHTTPQCSLVCPSTHLHVWSLAARTAT